MCPKPPPLTIPTGPAVGPDGNPLSASEMSPFLYSPSDAAPPALGENPAAKNPKWKHKDLTLEDDNNDGDDDFHPVKNLNPHVVDEPENIFDENRNEIEIETEEGVRIVCDIESILDEIFLIDGSVGAS